MDALKEIRKKIDQLNNGGPVVTQAPPMPEPVNCTSDRQEEVVANWNPPVQNQGEEAEIAPQRHEPIEDAFIPPKVHIAPLEQEEVPPQEETKEEPPEHGGKPAKKVANGNKLGKMLIGLLVVAGAAGYLYFGTGNPPHKKASAIDITPSVVPAPSIPTPIAAMIQPPVSSAKSAVLRQMSTARTAVVPASAPTTAAVVSPQGNKTISREALMAALQKRTQGVGVKPVGADAVPIQKSPVVNTKPSPGPVSEAKPLSPPAAPVRKAPVKIPEVKQHAENKPLVTPEPAAPKKEKPAVHKTTSKVHKTEKVKVAAPAEQPSGSNDDLLRQLEKARQLN